MMIEDEEKHEEDDDKKTRQELGLKKLTLILTHSPGEEHSSPE